MAECSRRRSMPVACQAGWSYKVSSFSAFVYVGVSFTPLFIDFEEIPSNIPLFFIFKDPRGSLQKPPFSARKSERRCIANATRSDSAGASSSSIGTQGDVLPCIIVSHQADTGS